MPPKLTTCQAPNCGTTFAYNTKPPKLCPACRSKAADKPKRRRRPPKRSKQQLQVSKIIREAFPDKECITDGYYSWLLSPRGNPMQLDIYLPELKLAVEVDGAQHYEFNPFMHKTVTAFEASKTRDKLKDQICKKRGITMIRIPYDRKITKEDLTKCLIETLSASR